MGKKARVKNTFTEEDLEFIESKKSVGSGNNKVIKEYKNVDKALSYKLNFKAKNDKQKLLYNTIGKKEICLVKGSAGVGKTYTIFAKALNLLKSSDNSYNQILVLNPQTQMEDIGYLPGDLEQKIYNTTINDRENIIKLLDRSGNNGKEVLDELIKNNLIKFDCAAYYRGRTLDNKIVLVSESSSYSQFLFFSIITRIGENSCYVFSGDPEQSDLLRVKKNKEIDGLTYAFKKFENVDEIGKIEFTDEDEIVRNNLIRKIIDAWKTDDNGGPIK